MQKPHKIPDFSLVAKKSARDRARMVAVERQKFFKESFVKGAFTDRAFIARKKRTCPRGGNKIQIGKGNTIKRCDLLSKLYL